MLYLVITRVQKIRLRVSREGLNERVIQVPPQILALRITDNDSRLHGTDNIIQKIDK